ncbi:MAG: acetate--CoA ligase family protein [Candidatus Gracilibacteria bacterium]|nr:acetate--CoA ligase family protein [Candidatus Gracilibacteria bacterium]
MKSNLNFFEVSSVVIIGASEVEGKIGNSLVKNLDLFLGEKFGVNPKGGEYNGVKFYKDIISLPTVPDIAVIAIPAQFVQTSLEDCGKKGIKRVVVISAGFKEIGDMDSENKLIEISKKYNISLLGPNCLGYVDTSKNLNLSFGTKTLSACVGGICENIAMVSQSGAMAVALTDWALSRNMGFSKMISMGNKAGINENDLLIELENDPKTSVISLYLESIDDGERFLNITKNLSKKKPIVLVKSGISDKGSLAASSHTGALSSQKEILETAFKNAGIHYTQSLEDFFLWSHIFSRSHICDIPEELVIITNAGGPGVMATDHVDFNNVVLSEFTQEEKDVLKTGLPDAASVKNPIDIIGDATSKTYAQVLNNLSKLNKKRAILILLTAQVITDVENIANIIIDFKIKNPCEFIMVSFMGGEAVQKGREILSNAGILEYDYPKKAILAYSELIKQKRWSLQKEETLDEISLPSEDIINNIKSKIKDEISLCNNYLTGEIFKTFNINFLDEILVKNVEEISGVYDNFGGSKLVARISSPDIAHKTDVGGVILNIKSKEEAIDAYKSIIKNVQKHKKDALILGVTFCKMIEKTDSTQEIFVGFKRDVSFGDILIVGMGGIFVNVYEDVTRAIGLVSKRKIREMFRELKGYPILEGARGQKGINFDSLIDTIYKLQYVFNTFEEIIEIDINPIFSDDKESVIVDAKFYI